MQALSNLGLRSNHKTSFLYVSSSCFYSAQKTFPGCQFAGTSDPLIYCTSSFPKFPARVLSCHQAFSSGHMISYKGEEDFTYGSLQPLVIPLANSSSCYQPNLDSYSQPGAPDLRDDCMFFC